MKLNLLGYNNLSLTLRPIYVSIEPGLDFDSGNGIIVIMYVLGILISLICLTFLVVSVTLSHRIRKFYFIKKI